MTNSDGTVDAPYTFGRPVETYVSPTIHARLVVLKSDLGTLFNGAQPTPKYLKYSEWSVAASEDEVTDEEIRPSVQTNCPGCEAGACSDPGCCGPMHTCMDYSANF